MQGKKYYQEKIFTSFQLSNHVPEYNFYRRLNAAIDLDFLYHKTCYYYGACGQKSIDPVVFKTCKIRDEIQFIGIESLLKLFI